MCFQSILCDLEKFFFDRFVPITNSSALYNLLPDDYDFVHSKCENLQLLAYITALL